MILSETEIAELRAVDEGEMHDSFTFYSPVRATVDGLEVDTWTVRGSSLGSVTGRSTGAADTTTRTVKVGGVDRDVLEAGVKLPVSASPVPAIGWELECTAIGPVSDPALLGRRWRVVSAPTKSYATARRLDVVDLAQE